MGKGRIYNQVDVRKAVDHINNLPSQTAGRFDAEVGDASDSESPNHAMHEGEFTLTEIKRFLESHGFNITIDELLRLRRLAGKRDANSDPAS